ncbi:MAG: putative phosphoglycerate mutase [Parcubacteria group bacterium Gr01-1014_106]|nr:MAG: putative phosphoglycerate mutase [Parcubacteria group bacterium Gr01-1014_106]
MKATLHTDGGARGNPGPAAIGVVLEIEEKDPAHVGEAIGEATNNVAEYRALIRGLEEAKKAGVTELECRLDSELLVKQLNREYKVRDANLASLFVRAWNLAQGFRSIRFIAIPRKENQQADTLVNQALDAANRPRHPSTP